MLKSRAHFRRQFVEWNQSRGPGPRFTSRLRLDATIDAATCQQRQHLIVPEQLREHERILLRILLRTTQVGECDDVTIQSRFDDPPPFGHAFENVREMGAVRHDGDLVEDPRIQPLLFGETRQRVLVALDFEPVEPSVDHGDINPDVALTDAEFVEQPGVTFAGVLSCQPVDERGPDVGISHGHIVRRIRTYRYVDIDRAIVGNGDLFRGQTAR